MIGQINKITEEIVFNVIARKKQFPNMSAEDVGRLTGISGASARKIISQYNYCVQNPNVNHAVYSGITPELFTYIGKAAGIENLPKIPVCGASNICEKKEKEKQNDSKYEKHNEDIYLTKVIDGIGRILMKLNSIDSKLASIEETISKNEREKYTPTLDSMSRSLEDIRYGVKDGFDSLKCTIKKNGVRFDGR